VEWQCRADCADRGRIDRPAELGLGITARAAAEPGAERSNRPTYVELAARVYVSADRYSDLAWRGDCAGGGRQLSAGTPGEAADSARCASLCMIGCATRHRRRHNTAQPLVLPIGLNNDGIGRIAVLIQPKSIDTHHLACQ